MNKFMRKFNAIDIERVSINGCVLDVIDAEENTVGSDAGFSDEFMTAGEMRIEINYCSNILSFRLISVYQIFSVHALEKVLDTCLLCP